MTQVSAHKFPDLYKSLGIDLNKLGCIMLDIEDNLPMPKSYEFEVENFYHAKNKAHFWIDGYCADKNPHVTLLYGLLTPAYEQPENIKTVLEDWAISTVKIADIGYFPSTMEDEQYYCLIALIEVTPRLLEGSQRLEFLPHVNTFTEYKPHMTIAYIKKDDKLRDRMISDLRKLFVGRELKVNPKLNLGSNKK